MHFAIRVFRKSRVEPLGEDGVEVGVGGGCGLGVLAECAREVRVKNDGAGADGDGVLELAVRGDDPSPALPVARSSAR